MNFVRPCLMACPIVFYCFPEMESGCQIYGYICRIVCAGIDGTAFIDWYMEFYFRRRCWNLYAYASRLYYGVLFGEYHDSK